LDLGNFGDVDLGRLERIAIQPSWRMGISGVSRLVTIELSRLPVKEEAS
jgi:hypothetical protein